MFPSFTGSGKGSSGDDGKGESNGRIAEAVALGASRVNAPPCPNLQCAHCHGEGVPPVELEDVGPQTWDGATGAPLLPRPRLMLQCGQHKSALTLSATLDLRDATYDPMASVVKRVPINTDALRKLLAPTTHQGFHILPVRMDVEWTASNAPCDMQINMTTENVDADGRRTIRTWFATNCLSHGAASSVIIHRNSTSHGPRRVMDVPRIPDMLLESAAVDFTQLKIDLTNTNSVTIGKHDNTGHMLYTTPLEWLYLASGAHAMPGGSGVINTDRRNKMREHLRAVEAECKKGELLMNLDNLNVVFTPVGVGSSGSEIATFKKDTEASGIGSSVSVDIHIVYFALPKHT